MSAESLYQEIILDHYRHPRARGLREPFDAEVRHVNPTCGDEITLRVRLDGDRIEDVSYEGVGCSISQASASVLAELVTGGTLAEAAGRHEAFVAMLQSRGESEPDEDLLEDGVAFLGVSRFPARVKCALLSWMALRDATARAVGAQVQATAAAPSGGWAT